MNTILNYNSFLGRAFSIIVDFLVLSCIWLLTSLPIFTIGASTSALYYTVNKVLLCENGKIAAEYKHAFLSNFKQATIIWLVQILCYAIMGLSCFYAFGLLHIEAVPKMYVVVLCILVAFFVAWSMYLLPYVARINDTSRIVFSNCLRMMLSNIGYSVLILISVIVSIISICVYPLLIFIIPGFLTWVTALLLEKVFKKYMNPVDILDLIPKDENRND